MGDNVSEPHDRALKELTMAELPARDMKRATMSTH
jgi:hypothetical protein